MYSQLTGASAPKVSQNVEPRHARSTGAKAVRLLRLRDVLEIIPVSKSAWFAGIKAGHFPKGSHLGRRVTVWRSDVIEQLINEVR